MPKADWSDVLTEVRELDTAYRKLSSLRGTLRGILQGKDPEDIESLVGRCVYLGPRNVLPLRREGAFHKWVKDSFPSKWSTVQWLGRAEEDTKDAGAALFDGGPEHPFQESLGKVVQKVQALLDEVAPERLTYQGFAIKNPDHLPDITVRNMLDGVDYMLAVFKRRGMEKLFRTGIKSILLVAAEREGGPAGYYQGSDQQITLVSNALKYGGRIWHNFLYEVLAHEFGHFVHMTYIHDEAKAAWDAPWTAIEAERAKVDNAIGRVSKGERQRFFSLLEESKWDLTKTAAKLKGIDKIKFAAWLRGYGTGPLITPKQFRLTDHGHTVFNFFRDPEGFLAKDYGYDPPRLREVLERRQRVYRGNMFLDDDYAMQIPSDIVADLRKADPAIDKAVTNLVETLHMPTSYAQTNSKEDFAETFAAFVLNPSMLSDTAKERMQRALSLSGLYHKPVMHLAHRVLERWLESHG